jgi:hypothetical protein
MARVRAKLADKDLFAHIEATIPDFHSARLASLTELKLKKLLRRKNPYLFRAKNVLVASELIDGFLAAHLSSQEEGLFGTFLEQLAIFVAMKLWGGQKSPTEGLDLDVTIRGQRYFMVIKSGPNWGNSRQIAGMRADFRRAQRVLRTNAKPKPAICVNGCCYGRVSRENQGDYMKIAGQSFWELLTGDTDLYRRIIIPIGHRAKERNQEFATAYAKVRNRFTEEFIGEFCTSDKAIDWDKLLTFNSGKN